jgi:hypothetical protein
MNTDPLETIVATKWFCPSDYFPLLNYTYYNLSFSNESNSKYVISESFNLNVWRGKTICAKRYNLSKYEYDFKAICADDYIDCGLVNSFHDKLCIKNDTSNFECPINEFRIENSSLTITEENNKLNLTDGYYIKYSKTNKNSLIPIDFSIRDNYCLIFPDKIYNLSDSFSNCTSSPEKLCYQCKENNNEIIDDTRWKFTDSVDKQKFYQQNDVKFPYNGNSTYSSNLILKYRSYVMNNMNCFNRTLQFSYLNIFNSNRNLEFGSVIINLLHICILFLFNALLNLEKIESKVHRILFAFLKLVFSYLYIISNLVIQYHIYFNTFQIKTQTDLLGGQECLDETTMYVKDYSKLIDNIKQAEILGWYLFYILFSYLFLLLIETIKFCHKNLVRLKNKYIENRIKLELHSFKSTLFM